MNFSSVQFSLSVVPKSLQPHGLKHARLPCPSTTPGAYSNSCPSSQWCHPTISSSVIPLSCLQSFPASGSLQMSQFFTSGGQSIGVSASASVLLQQCSGKADSHCQRRLPSPQCSNLFPSTSIWLTQGTQYWVWPV